MAFDRYGKFRNNGSIDIVPFIKIPKRNTDYYEVYRIGRTKLDALSYQYYDNCDYAWLIMQANPEFGSIEYEIPDTALLRIPYPLDEVLGQYVDDINSYNKYN